MTTKAPDPAAQGAEMLLYDSKRRPANWTDIVLPHQCAVFLRDRELSRPVGGDLKPRSAGAATCVVFDSIDRAEAYCRRLADEHRRIEGEILDHEGRIHPPLVIVTSSHAGGEKDSDDWLSRNGRWLAAVLITCGVPFFVYDFIHEGSLVLTIIGINFVVAGLRFLLWGAGAKRAERARLARVAEHRTREQHAAARH